MSDTPLSLLQRARQADQSGWTRLVDVYTPLLRRWMAGWSVQPADAEDLIQEVFQAVHAGLGTFQHNGHAGAFRRWLRTILVNRLRNFCRQRGASAQGAGGPDLNPDLAALEDPHSDLSRHWDAEHDRHVMHRLLELIRPEFTEATWKAFCRQALDGASPGEVAAELGLTSNAVCIARSRVLRRLRQEAQGLLEL